jgi:hypothetical protein
MPPGGADEQHDQQSPPLHGLVTLEDIDGLLGILLRVKVQVLKFGARSEDLFRLGLPLVQEGGDPVCRPRQIAKGH